MMWGDCVESGQVTDVDMSQGAFNVGWISDAYSRKYTIVFAVVIFTIGSVLQVAAVDYAMLVVARLIGGVGIGL